MIVTAELSLYPLQENYEESIIDFIHVLKTESDVEVMTHAMSTFIRGDSTLVFQVIDQALKAANEKTETLSLVIKLINRNLPVDKGFINF